MSDEERKDLPPESTPQGDGDSWPLEDAADAAADAVGPSERPEDRLGEELGDKADSVTRELRDLQDELIPPPEPNPAAHLPPPMEAPEYFSEPVGEAPALEPPDISEAAARVGDYSARGAGSGATSLPEGTDDDRLLSMLAWLSMVILQIPVVSLIQLFSENTKNRPFQRHHAVTSLLFYAASFVYEIVAAVVFTILTTVTLGCAAICLWVIFFVPHALALYYAFQAYGGKRVEVPYLSRFARQQGWM